MSTATLDLTDILRRLAVEGVHIATSNGQRYLVIAGTDADDSHPYAVGLAVNDDNEPITNKLTSLTIDGNPPRRAWRQTPVQCHSLGMGDIMGMAEAAYNREGRSSLRRCVDHALVSIWCFGVQPDMLDILMFMQSAVDSGDLAAHEHTTEVQIERILGWLTNPVADVAQFYFAECLTARLAMRIEKRAARQLADAKA